MLEVVDLRESLVALVSVLQLLLEFISVVCVVIGLVKTLMVLVQLNPAAARAIVLGTGWPLHWSFSWLRIFWPPRSIRIWTA